MQKRALSILIAAVGPLVVFLTFVLLWHFSIVLFDIKPYVLPAPEAVYRAFLRRYADLQNAFLITGFAALCGFMASFIFGTIIAFVFAQSRHIQRAFYPYAIFLQTVPIVAVAPLIIGWFGHEFRSVVIISFIVSLFPIITNATTGLTSIPANIEELFRLNKATRLQRLIKLQIPNSLPYMVAGAKISSGLSVIGVIIGELFAGFTGPNKGLGYIIYMTTTQLRVAETFAAIFLTTILGLVIFGTVSLIGALLLKLFPND